MQIWHGITPRKIFLGIYRFPWFCTQCSNGNNDTRPELVCKIILQVVKYICRLIQLTFLFIFLRVVLVFGRVRTRELLLSLARAQPTVTEKALIELSLSTLLITLTGRVEECYRMVDKLDKISKLTPSHLLLCNLSMFLPLGGARCV